MRETRAYEEQTNKQTNTQECCTSRCHHATSSHRTTHSGHDVICHVITLVTSLGDWIVRWQNNKMCINRKKIPVKDNSVAVIFYCGWVSKPDTKEDHLTSVPPVCIGSSPPLVLFPFLFVCWYFWWRRCLRSAPFNADCCKSFEADYKSKPAVNFSS